MKIRFSLWTNKVGSRCDVELDVDGEEWAALDEDGRSVYARDIFWDDALGRLGEWDWEEVE